MNSNDYRISDGYIGSMGLSWKTATDETLSDAIRQAAEFNSLSEAEVILNLESGFPVKWRESANFYYDHSYGIIQRKPSRPQPVMVRCDCGHSIPKGQVMNASLGTSCSDCYDKMSG